MSELDLDFFFFKLPLYKRVQITDQNWNDFLNLLKLGRGNENNVFIEGYNPFRGVESTFGGWGNVSGTDHFIKYGGTDSITIKCRRYDDVLFFFIHYDSESKMLMKVGQFPSVADFHIYELKRYSKVLSSEKLKEFSRAIGLAANGIGIGSFVYLRRIFEHLINQAHAQAGKDGKIEEAKFQAARMDDKIEMLETYLPDFLVENKSLYAILSLGIHELDEETCLAHFDTLRVGIEIILDEKLDEIRKKEKIETAKKKLAELKGDLKK